MAKKKSKEKINLNGSPLQAITIGEIKEHKYGWIGIIILFALFVGIVFYLPELFEMYEEYTRVPTPPAVPINNTAANTNTNTTKAPGDDKDDFPSYSFLEKTGFKFTEIDISDITYMDGIFSYKIKNKTEKTLDLSTLNLVIALYDNDNKLLITYNIYGFLDAGEKEPYVQNVSEEIASQVVSYNIIENADTNN